MSAVNIESVKDRVASLLEEYPALRDDDNRLLANIWYQDAKAIKGSVNYQSARDFLQLVANGKLTNPESVRRGRQLLQEKNPHLRGKSYTERKRRASEVKSEIIEQKNNIDNQEKLWQ